MTKERREASGVDVGDQSPCSEAEQCIAPLSEATPVIETMFSSGIGNDDPHGQQSCFCNAFSIASSEPAEFRRAVRSNERFRGRGPGRATGSCTLIFRDRPPGEDMECGSTLNRSLAPVAYDRQRSLSHFTFSQHPANLCSEVATTLALGLPPLLLPSCCSRPGPRLSSNAQGCSPAATAFRPLCRCKTLRPDIYGRNQRH